MRPTTVTNAPQADAAPPTGRARLLLRRIVPPPLRWARRRPAKAVVALVAAAFFLANVLAFVQAYTLTHFVQAGSMPRPDHLSRFGKLGVVLTGVRLGKPHNTTTPASLGLSYETVHYRGADGTEYEAWHIPAGGPPWRHWGGPRGVCVMFHGYAGCKATVLREAEVVRRAGYDTFLVDFRGSGGSSGSSTTVGYREADDVAEAVKYVRRNLHPTRLVIYGRSMGAAAALRAVALGKADPDAMVLESPFDRMLTTVAHRFDLVGVPAFPLARLLVFWGGVQQGYWAFANNPVEYARSVKCPTLMMRGGHDPFVRQREAESVFNNIAGTKQLVVFDRAVHEPCVAVDKARWSGRVTDFLLATPKRQPKPVPAAALAHAGG